MRRLKLNAPKFVFSQLNQLAYYRESVNITENYAR